MGRKTVKKRIFFSNARMVLVTLLLFLMINLGIIGIGLEMVGQEVKAVLEERFEKEDLEYFLVQWKQKRDGFLLLFSVDGVLCIGALVLVSQMFTKNLTRHIMELLEALEQGAGRVRRNDLEQEIVYTGEQEFEHVCHAFNEMQHHILLEKQKNRKYEKARTDMIAGISHDLRTPLTAIQGTIKGLLDGVASTPQQQKKFLETAYRRTGETSVLLNQLFYLSKLETGNMPIQLQRVEFVEFLAKYVRSKQELLEGEKVEIIGELEENRLYVQIDSEQMLRILDNLLENSRKYAETEPLCIHIRLKQEKGKARICFRDNGIGAPEEKLPHIFEEFYRGDESRNRKEGNGLGFIL